MKITDIRAYQVDLPLHEGGYAWADGKTVTVFDSTIVEVHTDAGLTGYGEVCPLGPSYLPAYAEGVRTGIRELAPSLIGLDPRETGRVNDVMDRALRGHGYVKSGLDMACWDLLGQAARLPLAVLLGGRFGDDFPLYRAISQDTPGAMADCVAAYRDQGYQAFQLKVGGDPAEDIERIHACYAELDPGQRLIADANTGWRAHEALQVVDGVSALAVYIEQPCATYEECTAVRQRCAKPMVLDESIRAVSDLQRLVADRAADVVNIKISKVGGVTKARVMRDLCVSQGIAVTLEDSWGGDVATTAIAHLVHSTPVGARFTTTDFNSYVTRQLATGAPRRVDGRLTSPDRPGLGIQIDRDALGEPAVHVSMR